MTFGSALLGFSFLCFLCALVPAIMFRVNLHYYTEPLALNDNRLPAISVLIPARNEAGGISDALQAILQSRHVYFEIIVMDDSSADDTPALVAAIAQQDPRVRLEHAPPLAADWNGKQNACWALAKAARNPILCFVDADVRLGPDCLARMAQFLETSGSSLVSGFPRQLTGSFLEWLLLPLIHFVLLGFLPIARMRMGTDPAFAAGCGQFMMARREEYFTCGGHSGIRLTMHDGLRLPKLFREHGLRTDLADITNLATCRMYNNAAQVWNGLAKNATEGIAAPARIVPVSILLILGQVLPAVMMILVLSLAAPAAVLLGSLGMDMHLTYPFPLGMLTSLLVAAAFCAFLPRILATTRFHQDWRSALLHPLGITLLLAIQWYALFRKLLHRPIPWRSRSYPAAP